MPQASSRASTTSLKLVPPTTLTISPIRQGYTKVIHGTTFLHQSFNLQNYAVCIRVENGYCGIRYSQVTNDIYSFTVSGDSAQTSFMLASSEVKYGDTDCRNDYIIIPGGSDNGVNNEFSRDRHLIMSSYSKTCTFHQNYAFLDFVVTLWGLAPPLREPCALQRLDQ